MKLSVNDIAAIVHAEVMGESTFIIKGVSSFDDAEASDITFASDPKFLAQIDKTKAGAIVVPASFMPTEEDAEKIIFLKSNNPKIAFFKIVSLFHPAKKIQPGVHGTAAVGEDVKFGINPTVAPNVFIGDNVRIGDNVHLMPGVYIGDDVSIGHNAIIKPNVTIMEKSRIGNTVLIHSGTVIGSDGFGFAQLTDTHEKLIHTGYVDIGNNVEIGAGNTIDRGTLGTTVIGNGVKTDNLVHIAHNVKIGDNTLIVAQVGIAGSAVIGKNVIIAGKSGVSGHIKIGNGSIIGPFSGVYDDVAENKIVSGLPHMPHKRWRKVVAIVSRLPEIRKKIFSFEKRLKALENKKK